MSVDTLLSRLEKVKRTGKDSWIACCPAHEDRSPSLSVRDNDGLVLCHCFAGCSVEAVACAAGVDLADLFPVKPMEQRKAIRRPFNAHDVLACIATEARIVAIAAGDVAQGRAISAVDHKRLLTAVSRIEAAQEIASG